MKIRDKFALLTDEEWIDELTKTPANEEAHEYFFKKKCANLLKYISLNIYKNENCYELLGDFYILISQDNWRVLRNFENRKNATLYSYLTRCAVNHFITKRKKEMKFEELHYSIDNNETDESLNNLVYEEYVDNTQIMTAYNALEPRFKETIQLLVLDGKSSIEAADQLWPYVKSKNNWRDMPVVRVQNTIAMMKHRAIFELTTKLNSMQ